MKIATRDVCLAMRLVVLQATCQGSQRHAVKSVCTLPDNSSQEFHEPYKSWVIDPITVRHFLIFLMHFGVDSVAFAHFTNCYIMCFLNVSESTPMYGILNDCLMVF